MEMNRYYDTEEYRASEDYLKEQIKQDNLCNEEGDIYESAINHAFVAGAKWKEQQMMKNVVLETTIIKDDDGCAEDFNYEEWLEYENNEIIEMPEWCKEGDKVKAILIKDE